MYIVYSLIGVVIVANELKTISEKIQRRSVLQEACGNIPSSELEQFFNYYSSKDNSIWGRLHTNLLDNTRIITKFGVQSYKVEKSITESENQDDYEHVKECLSNVGQCNQVR